jgi:hypothetical protein
VQSNGTFCRSTTPTSFWYVVYIVYQKAHRKWLVSRVCLVAQLQPVQDFPRLLRAKLLELTGMHECNPMEHFAGPPLLQVFGMLFILYLKRHIESG